MISNPVAGSKLSSMHHHLRGLDYIHGKYNYPDDLTTSVTASAPLTNSSTELTSKSLQTAAEQD